MELDTRRVKEAVSMVLGCVSADMSGVLYEFKCIHSLRGRMSYSEIYVNASINI